MSHGNSAGRAVAAGLLALAVLGGVGCAAPHGRSVPLGPPSSGNGPPSAPGPDVAPSALGLAPVAWCTHRELNITDGGHDASSGHRGFILVFTNKSTATCRTKGYPGVDAINGRGDLMEHARRTLSGYEGGLATGTPQTVYLAPGQSASALVEALAFRASDGSACTRYESLLVIVPDDTAPQRIAWNNDRCSDLQVHPMVPGVTGRSG